MLVHTKYGVPPAMKNAAMIITTSAWRMECRAFFPFLHRCMREEFGKKKLQELFRHRCHFCFNTDTPMMCIVFQRLLMLNQKRKLKSQIHGLPGAMEICA